jgi:flagellar basal body-associated protein FliL
VESPGSNDDWINCAEHVQWARTEGMDTQLDYYTAYTDAGLTKDSSFADFQCALHDKVGPGGGSGHTCPQPCSANLGTFCTRMTAADTAIITAPTAAPSAAPSAEPSAAPSTDTNPDEPTPTAAPSPPPATTTVDVSTTTAPLVTNATTTAGSGSSGSFGSSSSSGSLDWWGWLLLALLLLACAAAAAYFLMGGKGKSGPQKKKKTRAVKAATAAVPDVSVPIMQAQQYVTTAAPVYVQSTAQPQYQVAQATRSIQMAPMQAAPVVQYAAPAVGSVSMAPTMAYAQPVATYAAQPMVANFNQFDTNNDGVISRSEFNAAMIRR